MRTAAVVVVVIAVGPEVVVRMAPLELAAAEVVET
jgi:hypothetical protein